MQESVRSLHDVGSRDRTDYQAQRQAPLPEKPSCQTLLRPFPALSKSVKWVTWPGGHICSHRSTCGRGWIRPS